MFKRIFITVLVLISLVSCSRLSNSMLSDRDRKNELATILPKVVQIYLWKSYGDLSKYLKDPDSDLLTSILKSYQDHKISEVLQDEITYEEDATRAFVVLEVKSFSAPTYVLESHFDQLEWRFDNSSGWKLVDINLGKAEISN